MASPNVLSDETTQDMKEGDEGPYTERSSDKTSNVDVASVPDAIRMIQRCEEEIFTGWRGSPGLLDNNSLVNKLGKLAEVAANMLRDPAENIIILSGCGTSGRLAFLIAKWFNAKLKSRGKTPCFRYIIAGGDRALFRSMEASEDVPQEGARVLADMCQGKKHVMFIGITCGFSAPFVAGQLDYCLSHVDVITPVLLGFNSVQLARNTQIENWDKTFKDIASKYQQLETAGESVYVINPVLGPEPITGSSRMKGGTATLVLLEVLFTAALLVDETSPLGGAEVTTSTSCISQLFQCYSYVQKVTYSDLDGLASAAQLAGNALLQNGQIYYVSDTDVGIIGLIDSSECPPTFGCPFSDVQGFIPGGYGSLGITDSAILKALPTTATEDFLDTILPKVTHNDTVVLLQEYAYSHVIAAVLESPASVVSVTFATNGGDSKSFTANRTSTRFASLVIPAKELRITELLKGNESLAKFCIPFFREIAYKFVCNCISTNAFIMKGKVFGNFMVDVRVSNSKLFYRAMGIVARFAQCQEDQARQVLLSVIYRTDALSDLQLSASVKDHVTVANGRDTVVPIAIVVAKRGLSVEEAEQALLASPRIRKALQMCLVGGRSKDRESRLSDGDKKYRRSLSNNSDSAKV